jgi:hypothetical protein
MFRQQTVTENVPALVSSSCPIGTEFSFPRGKWPEHENDYSIPNDTR